MDITSNHPYIDIEDDEVVIPAYPMETTRKIEYLAYLLEKDLFSYFDLNEEYPTQLQKNAFKKTDEYSNYLEQLNADYKSTISEKFYILYNLRYNKPYDTNKKCFQFDLGVIASGTTKLAGYIGLSSNSSPASVCITFPQNRLTIKKELTYDRSDYWLSQYIRIPIRSEELALKIEKEIANPYCSIYLMFIVKPNKVSREIHPRYGYYQDFILAKTIGLYIVDVEKETILCDLSNLFSTVKK